MTDRTSTGTTARWAGVVAVGWGAALLVGGRRLFGVLEQRPPSGVEAATIRVLGARHLVQGVTQVVRPGWAPGVLATVDLTHAASMLALASVRPADRRAALLSAAVAASTAALTLAPTTSR